MFVVSADFSDSARGEIYSTLLLLARNVPPPVEVVSVRHESPWTILVGLPVAGVVWAMQRMVGPVILRAWDESQLKENFGRFVRDNLFQGAKEQLEASAAAKPQYGNLAIIDVSAQRGSGAGRAELRVTLKRTEVLEIETNDRELMNKFLARIGMRPR